MTKQSLPAGRQVYNKDCFSRQRQDRNDNFTCMIVEKAPDIDKIVRSILKRNLFPYIDASRIVSMRSSKATSRARARIWSFPHIWQLALNQPAHYIIEVLSQHFDHLSQDDKTRVIIHELMHIPKNFSGALIPHHGIHKRITNHTVEQIFKEYKNNC